MREAEMIAAAMQLAAEFHAGQKRVGLDEPYVLHPYRVALLAASVGSSSDVIAAAALHDVVEDSACTLDDLRARFSRRTVDLIALLSKGWTPGPGADAARLRYFDQIRVDPEARLLKVLDRIDNLRDAVRIPSSYLRATFGERYLEKTLRDFPPLLEMSLPPPVRHWYMGAVQALTEKVKS